MSKETGSLFAALRRRMWVVERHRNYGDPKFRMRFSRRDGGWLRYRSLLLLWGPKAGTGTPQPRPINVSRVELAWKAFDRNDDFLPVGDEWNDACYAMDEIVHVLRQYADPRNWSIERDDFRNPRAVWIGPGATKEPYPDAPGLARDVIGDWRD